VKKITAAIGVQNDTQTAEDGTKNMFINFDEDEDEEDIESQEARARVLRKYDQAQVVENVIENEKVRAENAKNLYEDRLEQWKRDYYRVSNEEQLLTFSTMHMLILCILDKTGETRVGA